MAPQSFIVDFVNCSMIKILGFVYGVFEQYVCAKNIATRHFNLGAITSLFYVIIACHNIRFYNVVIVITQVQFFPRLIDPTNSLSNLIG